MSRGPVVPDRQMAVLRGVAFVCVGAFLLYDAYDARGRSRPFLMKLLPG